MPNFPLGSKIFLISAPFPEKTISAICHERHSNPHWSKHLQAKCRANQSEQNRPYFII
jgi:hypothetical protein